MPPTPPEPDATPVVHAELKSAAPAPPTEACPVCKRALHAEQSLCPDCGVPAIVTAKPQRLCARCWYPLAHAQTRCGECGTVWKKACMDCGYPLSTEQRACPECGAVHEESAAKFRWRTPRKVALGLLFAYLVMMSLAAGFLPVADTLPAAIPSRYILRCFIGMTALCSLLLAASFVAVTWGMPQRRVQIMVTALIAVTTFPVNYAIALFFGIYLSGH